MSVDDEVLRPQLWKELIDGDQINRSQVPFSAIVLSPVAWGTVCWTNLPFTDSVARTR